MISRTALLTVLLVGVKCLYISNQYKRPKVYVEDSVDLIADDLEDFYSEQPFESVHPVHVRERREAHGVINTNPDGTTNMMAKLPLGGNDKNILSVVGGLDSIKAGRGFGAGSAGLDNVNGHSLNLTAKRIPTFGDQLTAAAKLNLANTGKHDFIANAFATKTLLNNPVIPNFSTYGGGVDYMFELGASLGVANKPQGQKTDYSAMGKLNLFHDRSSTLDFSVQVRTSLHL